MRRYVRDVGGSGIGKIDEVKELLDGLQIDRTVRR